MIKITIFQLPQASPQAWTPTPTAITPQLLARCTAHLHSASLCHIHCDMGDAVEPQPTQFDQLMCILTPSSTYMYCSGRVCAAP
eukprot:2031615-Pleurochrysis_carterae.AAC.1